MAAISRGAAVGEVQAKDGYRSIAVFQEPSASDSRRFTIEDTDRIEGGRKGVVYNKNRPLVKDQEALE